MSVLEIGKALLCNKFWKVSKSALEKKSRNLVKKGEANFLFLYYPHPIPESQLYPFYFYSKQLRDDLGLNLAVAKIDDFESILPDEYPQVEYVGVQTWFDLSSAQFSQLFDSISRKFPEAKRIYFDWFAPTDIRHAGKLDQHVQLYVKKNTFRNLSEYENGHFGDSNLSSYYDKLYDIDSEWKEYELPDSFLEKVVTGPSFITAPYLIELFEKRSQVNRSGARTIDLHARLGATGEGWYHDMRMSAISEVDSLKLERVAKAGAVGFNQYLRELANSKVTFSPFGYGEVCWRDFEAIALGSVLLKPNMDHIRSIPDVYVDGETYMSMEWDFSDLSEKAEYLLGNPAICRTLSHNAFEAVHGYFKKKCFVDHVSQLISKCCSTPDC